ncbi:MAG: TIGR03618 family F420-dependent PPOX class oxidoreductase [Chloroflexi bacterium]|nr:TIGR03618 family F420-dependent PPOX class oxidoreductase [Chloroflexota bacterium]MDA1226356.1 TIGR03618 family F420-dependent PPOX class oxidoreductase [Chloroflexota bacterium]
MDFEDVRPFMESHHRGVIGTRRANGATHSSIVACGAFQGKAAFVSVYPRSVKIRNIRRDPTCTILCVDDNWRSYAVVEGQAQLFDYSNTDAAEIRQMLRDVYRACSATEHPNWNEFDQAMIDQKAVVVLVPPEQVYGMLR